MLTSMGVHGTPTLPAKRGSDIRDDELLKGHALADPKEGTQGTGQGTRKERGFGSIKLAE